jgi:pimeloyl-ACP methyl ester carboxylesterase
LKSGPHPLNKIRGNGARVSAKINELHLHPPMIIHALPGMGADRRMYPDPWPSLPGFKAHDWVRHTGEKSLAEMAVSMAEGCGIQDGDVLVGSSLGGMVACEITKIRRVPALYLIGSAVRKEEISGLLATLHPLAKIAPIDWLRFSAGKIPMDLTQMFSGMETSFIREMSAAIFQWEGLGETTTRVFRLHGSRDLVIPPPARADLLVAGGHLISISHAKECLEFIRTREKQNGSPEDRAAIGE